MVDVKNLTDSQIDHLLDEIDRIVIDYDPSPDSIGLGRDYATTGKDYNTDRLRSAVRKWLNGLSRESAEMKQSTINTNKVEKLYCVSIAYRGHTTSGIRHVLVSGLVKASTSYEAIGIAATKETDLGDIMLKSAVICDGERGLFFDKALNEQ